MDLTQIDLLTLRQLIEAIEADNDIDNTILILQLIELNLEAEIEKEEELLKDTPQLQAKKALKSKVEMMIEGFMEKPLEFLGEKRDIGEYVDEKIGFSLIPKTKNERSIKAGEILKAAAEHKLKKEKIKERDIKSSNRKELAKRLKEIKKELEKQREITQPVIQ